MLAGARSPLWLAPATGSACALAAWVMAQAMLGMVNQPANPMGYLLAMLLFPLSLTLMGIGMTPTPPPESEINYRISVAMVFTVALYFLIGTLIGALIEFLRRCAVLKKVGRTATPLRSVLPTSLLILVACSLLVLLITEIMLSGS